MKEKTSSFALWAKAKEEVFQYCFSVKLIDLKPLKDWGCYQSQSYKIWKQFKTCIRLLCRAGGLLSITKLQNLKAIHNKALRAFLKWRSCYQSQNYKIWKQFITIHLVKHNKHVVVINYKIWKQFTTSIHKGKPTRLLLSIIKLQNLKAIHNGLFYRNYLYFVVINHNTIKFESNSQLFFIQISLFSRCYQSQNYKIWKQFTTMPIH